MAVDTAKVVADLKEAGVAAAIAGGTVIVEKVLPDALEAAKAAIPGMLDDVLIEALKPALVAALKAELAKLKVA